MKTILVTGSNGFLGQKITEKILEQGKVKLIATAKGANRYPIAHGYVYAEMDITNPLQVKAVLEKHQPQAIIHTAALTNVDVCEANKETAYALNVTAVQNLANLCEQLNIQLIYLSTDFVFDGEAGPYHELDKPNPISYYGQTKLMGEEIVGNSKASWAIVRTILVYGLPTHNNRSNIVLWAKNALETGEAIQVINDQWRMPTLVEDLVDSCLAIVHLKAQGIFHVSGKDKMSIAQLVFKVANFWKLDSSNVVEVSTATLNQPAKRPATTGFILDKAMTELNYKPHSFDEGLASIAKQLQNKFNT